MEDTLHSVKNLHMKFFNVLFSNYLKLLKYLKSLAFSRGYYPVIDKALKKFKKPKHFVCHSDRCLNPAVLSFYFSISFKFSKTLSRFDFIVSFRLVNKIKLFSPKDDIPSESWSGIYFISCYIWNLGYIGQTRIQLKARLDEHRPKVKNEEILPHPLHLIVGLTIIILILQSLVLCLLSFPLLI